MGKKKMISSHSVVDAKEKKWQVARGIAIICVILIHCPNGIQLPHDSLGFNTWLVMRQFINFPVALFFFMAGRFQNIEKYDNYWTFLKNRGGYRLLFPFLFWSTIYAFSGSLKSILANEQVDVINTLLKIGSGSTAPHLYYIIVLIMFTICAPILVRCVKSSHKWIRIAIYGLTPMWFCFLYWFSITHKMLPKMYNYIPFSWILFYIHGLSIRYGIVTLNNKSARLGRRKFLEKGKCFVLITAIILEIVEAYLILGIGGPVEFACSQIRISAFLLTFVVIYIFEKWNYSSDSAVYRFLSLVGDYSYGIYFVHYFFVLIGKKLTQILSVKLNGLEWFNNILIVLPISLLGSMLFIFLIRMLFKKFNLLKYVSYFGL